MNKKNLLVFILGGVAVLFLLLFLVVFDAARRSQSTVARLEGEKNNLTGELEALRTQQKGLATQIATLSSQIQALNGEKAKLQEQIDGGQKERDALKGTVEKLTSELSRISSDASALGKENSNLKDQLKTVIDRKVELETKMGEFKTKNAALEESIASMKEKVKQLEALKAEPVVVPEGENIAAAQKQLQAQDGSVKLPSIVVKGQEDARRTVSAQAKPREMVNLPQITVNSGSETEEARTEIGNQMELEKASIVAVYKENNFVVVNQGTSQGLKIGDTLRVFDVNERPAGEIEIIQVRQNIAAADIKKEIQPFRTGFSVR